MNILLISSPFVPTPPPGYGGTQRDVAIIAEELATMGHEITVIASEGSSVPGCRVIRTVEWHEGQTFADQRSGAGDLIRRFWSAVIKHLENTPKYDIVNSHAWMPSMPYERIRLLSSKLCVTIHGGGACPQNNIFVSKSHRDHFKKEARYVYNPIDARKYQFRNDRGGYLAFLARIDFAKGADIAIKISRKTGIPLKIAGNISNKSYFEKDIKPHLGNDIEYTGQIGGKEKSDFLGKAMVVLYPSRLRPEPFGRVPLEANCCGTPVIAYNNGGLREVIRQGETGFLVNSEQDMEKRLSEVHTIIAEKCREWVTGNFSPRCIAERYLQCYCDLQNGVTWG